MINANDVEWVHSTFNVKISLMNTAWTNLSMYIAQMNGLVMVIECRMQLRMLCDIAEVGHNRH